MNNQETFDFVARALVKQGRPSVNRSQVDTNGSPLCCYRAPDGAKCAAGHLIPDDRYSTRFEGESVRDSRVRFALDGFDIPFIAALQNAHDQATIDKRPWLEAWAERMRTVAARYELSTDVLDEALAEREARFK